LQAALFRLLFEDKEDAKVTLGKEPSRGVNINEKTVGRHLRGDRFEPGMGGLDNIDRLRHVRMDRSRRRADDVSTKLTVMRFCYCGYKTK